MACASRKRGCSSKVFWLGSMDQSNSRKNIFSGMLIGADRCVCFLSLKQASRADQVVPGEGSKRGGMHETVWSDMVLYCTVSAEQTLMEFNDKVHRPLADESLRDICT